MQRMRKRLDQVSPRTTLAVGILVVVAVGFADYATGPEVAFLVFYLLPVSLVAWKCGPASACGFAAAAAVIWLVADLGAGQDYGHGWIAVWNSATRFVVFTIVVFLANVQGDLETQTKLAMRDHLTGVLNGRSFNAAGMAAVTEAAANRSPFTVAYIDLDDFKSINDLLGHTGGDTALQLVGEALRSHVRSTDIVGRLGGDEFGVLFPRMGSDGARAAMAGLVERVRRGVAALPLDVTFSAGAATFLVAPRHWDEVLGTADTLMYQAKSAGKDGFVHMVVGEESDDAVPDHTSARSSSPQA